jgi:1-aminocyclopropane-1-carboxylate deaminase/D-cysteine desulfhydrase-like pyridoxal-dependent ACC family enzyme
MQIGVYPTPVDRLPGALPGGRDLWVKRDDRTAPRYGGNKVRKLERILDVVKASGASRIVTFGAAGSHHVLATALYAGDLGIGVDAVLIPQPRTPHVAENLRAISASTRVFPASSFAHAATIVVDRVACGAYYVPPGGSTPEGAMAYADAAKELLEQVARGVLPLPTVVVVTLGSGGTAAGLAAGFALARSSVRVRAVTVSEPRAYVAWNARRLAKECVHRGVTAGARAGEVRLEITERYLGDGYGHATPAALRAIEAAEPFGLTLDTTYTGKTFAAALDLPEADGPVLFWHTLSSAPMAPILDGVHAPGEEALPADVGGLLLGGRRQ